MSAVTRWVEYGTDAVGEASVVSAGQGGIGQRGGRVADGAVDADAFSIGAGNDRLYVDIDGDNTGKFVVLASGVELDPRFVARDITERLHNLVTAGTDTGYEYATCVWDNNRLKLYSGTLGQASNVSVVSGTQTAHLELGFGTSSPVGGTNNNTTGSLNNSYDTQGITVSGIYNGLFDEEYTIVVNNTFTINAPVKGGSNSYTGTMSVGGVFNNFESTTYTLMIDVSNGSTMGGGAGEVPKLTWESTNGSDDSPYAVDLLYPNYWYKVGTKGLMVKFTDAVFNSCPDVANYAWTVACDMPLYSHGSNAFGAPGTAYYIYGSTRGNDSGTTAILTPGAGQWALLGSRGLYFTLDETSNLYPKDEWRVVCRGPQPMSYDITNLNYGNVTVSTEAPVKAVIFEIMSGAIEMSTIKFGLQSHGTFEHHDANNDDTYFRFGTVGPGEPAGSGNTDGIEWWQNVVAADIADDTPPSYLKATKGNLPVVADADDSESIGVSSFMGMVSDTLFLNIKLGASEVGANSTINYRIFFDYS